MKKLLSVTSIAVAALLCLAGVSAFAAEKAPQKVIDLAHSTIASLGLDPVIVTAVAARNAEGKTLAEIQEADKQWMATPGIDGFMKSLMDSPCGQHLRELQQGAGYYAEIFVMDNQGANVCMSNKTSDYWQGDEAKFKESYKDGAGGIHISDVKFDDSTQAYLVQVSVPVKDGTTVIGAITVGVDIDRIDQ